MNILNALVTTTIITGTALAGTALIVWWVEKVGDTDNYVIIFGPIILALFVVVFFAMLNQ